jgi:hypothetical protein
MAPQEDRYAVRTTLLVNGADSGEYWESGSFGPWQAFGELRQHGDFIIESLVGRALRATETPAVVSIGLEREGWDIPPEAA